MSRNNPLDAPPSTPSEASDGPLRAPYERAPSYIRFKSPARRSDEPETQKPSTLPPPPFESEAEVTGLEWWLESHMALAASLLCLEQLHESGAEPGQESLVALDRASVVADRIAQLRDALYEVYCDAADPRMSPWTAEGSRLASYIQSLYAFCEGVVEAHATFAASARKGTPGFAVLDASLERLLPSFDEERGTKIIEALETLGIDRTSPVEPLRHVFRDLEVMIQLAGGLKRKLVAQRSA